MAAMKLKDICSGSEWRLLVVVSGECSTYGALASHRGVFSCYRAWPIGCEGLVDVACGLSSFGSQVLEHRLNSCGA